MLCLVLITAAVSTVSLIPSQSNDISSADSVDKYILTDGDKEILESSDVLEDIIKFINESEENSVFTITMNGNDTISEGFTLKEGIEVTLTSSSKGPFTLTVETFDERHFTVFGILTLENIILESIEVEKRFSIDMFFNSIWIDGYAGGGIKVEASGELIMNNGAVIQNCSATRGGGVETVGTFTMNGGKISGNVVSDWGGGVNSGELFAYTDIVFTMTGGEISGNTARAGGGVCNSINSTFIMEGGKISDNYAFANGGGLYIEMNSTFTMNSGEIIGNDAFANGGGLYNSMGSFTMEDGKIIGNTATGGGGVANAFGEFTMNGGVIGGNTAFYGGGVNNMGMFTITGGVISDNTATSYDGVGGGVRTEMLENLFILPAEGKEVVFSGNKAPTMRIHGIWESDEEIYQQNIINVKLDKIFNIIEKAPAYNNYDIGYSGDVFVVTINIIPNGGGTVAVKDKGEDIMYENGYVFVPAPYLLIDVETITLLATPKSGYGFVQFKIGDDEFSKNSIAFKVLGNMEVIAEFMQVSTQPEKPEQKDYVITATAGDGSTISPNGTVTVPYGENKTFLFSAKPGYQIKAVLVNGVEISSAELASGAYTFSNVMSNHTISVVSEVEAGSGGDLGGDGSDGTGSGPDESGSDNLYVIGIICAMLVVIAGAVVFVWRRGHFGSNNE